MTRDDLPADFDWADRPSSVTVDTGRAPIDLPSVLRPWDPAPIRALHGFARETIRERARLALEDSANESDARRPMSEVRARWILLTMAEQDAERRPAVPWHPADRGPDGRELLTRLGADPNRGRHVKTDLAAEHLAALRGFTSEDRGELRLIRARFNGQEPHRGAATPGMADAYLIQPEVPTHHG